MEVGFKSDTGIRRKNNEDACFILLPDKVYVVADGVGGRNAGEIASQTAVREIAGYMDKNPIGDCRDKYDVVRYLGDCIGNANDIIYDMASRQDENRGMATTIVIVYIKGESAYVANVGDSRAYIFREGQLVQLTEDHTYVNTLVKAGIISREEAEQDKRKNVITKALGADAAIEPDFFHLNICKDDVLLICTDGLYDEVSSDEIMGILEMPLSMTDMCNELTERANANGGHDNITVICIKVTGEDING